MRGRLGYNIIQLDGGAMAGPIRATLRFLRHLMTFKAHPSKGEVDDVMQYMGSFGIHSVRCVTVWEQGRARH